MLADYNIQNQTFNFAKSDFEAYKRWGLYAGVNLPKKTSTVPEANKDSEKKNQNVVDKLTLEK